MNTRGYNTFLCGKPGALRYQRMPHIAQARLLAIAMSDDLLFNPEEFAHLKECKDCIERWYECIAEVGRQLEQDG